MAMPTLLNLTHVPALLLAPRPLIGGIYLCLEVWPTASTPRAGAPGSGGWC